MYMHLNRLGWVVVLIAVSAAAARADEDLAHSHWSFRPLHRPVVPDVTDIDGPHVRSIRNDIDWFIVARLDEQGLSHSLPADRRVLLRRLSFDLLGLPPTPEATLEFSEDRSPDAYAELVDQLLESPHFGERWARHWLDVVRYGESTGFERNKITPHAWRYRDWVIHAMNSDMPYDEFIRMQLAGDVLESGDPLALIATGLLVVGPYDEIGNEEGSESMQMMTRQTELAELVGTISQSFLALTVDCARCHDHKFDPISQVDYYRMAAVVAGVKRGDRLLENDQLSPQNDELLQTVEVNLAELQPQMESWRQVSGQGEQAGDIYARQVLQDKPVAYWRLSERSAQEPALNQGTLGKAAAGHYTPGIQFGLPSLIDDDENSAIGVGSGARLVIPEFEKIFTERGFAIEFWFRLDSSPDDYVNLVGDGQSENDFNLMVYLDKDCKLRAHAQTEDGIAAIDSDKSLGVGEVYHIVSSWDRAGGELKLHVNGEPFSAEPSIGKPPNKAVPLHTDNPIYIGQDGRAPDAASFVIDEVAIYDKPLSTKRIRSHTSLGDPTTIERQSRERLLAELPLQQRSEFTQLLRDVSRWESLRKLSSGGWALAVKPTQPDATYILARGDFRQPGEIVAPGAVEAIPLADGPDANFGLPADAPEAERRVKLADWLTDPGNPLFARVIVNRLWQYHFGTGLVQTPNDFGLAGGTPSHPKLLDWLASELIEGGWRLKPIHRLILNSATYRQSSRFNAEASNRDMQNRWLWRYSPRRLDAESLRDAMLSVSGELYPTMGGPGYRDFDTTTHGPVRQHRHRDFPGSQYQRRTIYRTWIRSSENPLLNQFDCPDPSVRTPRRAVTTTPTQALAMLNNSFSIRQAEAFASRVQLETTGSETLESATPDYRRAVGRAYELAFCRRPTEIEMERAQKFASGHGLSQLCLVLFNASEFLYVD